jgi:uncharacterized protein YjiK
MGLHCFYSVNNSVLISATPWLNKNRLKKCNFRSSKIESEMRPFSFSIVLVYFTAEILTGCLGGTTENTHKDSKKKKKDASSFNLDIQEPSGLSFTATGDALYTVSDKNGFIYKISFTGDIIEKIHSGENDLEGIDVDKSNGNIWIVEEKQQKIYCYNNSGRLIEKISDIHIKTKDNSGFEGIAVNGNFLYILIEKNPGTLIVYDTSTKEWKHHSLSFADDYSGIDYDITDNTLWIVSDESKTLNHCNLTGKLIKSQKLDIIQAEGVAVDRRTNTAWIVSDAAHRLYRITLII